MTEARTIADPPQPGSSPSSLTDVFASIFALTKQQLVSQTSDDRLFQTGCAYLGEAFVIPDLGPLFPNLVEPVIETFLVDAAGACTPTGTDETLIDAVLPLASAMAARTIAALEDLGIDLDVPGYLTASVSPIDQVTNLAHLDDDRYGPSDGVGAVAIVGDGNGPRLAIEPVPHAPLRPNLPVEISQQAIDGFGNDGRRLQQAAPDRIVVFPQFGQLHSGPPPEVLNGTRTVRTLLVLRSATTPRSAR